jgi:putative oxidoreductase
LLLRIVLGLAIAGHGAQKLFGSFDGPGPRGTAAAFGGLRFRNPYAMAILAGLAEFVGGLAFAVGFLTPLAALAIAVVMLNAVVTVHWKNGFWATAGGYEFPLVIWATAIAVATTGGGRFSVDRLLGWADELSGVRWGIAVMAGSVLISLGTLTLGRHPATATAGTASPSEPSSPGPTGSPPAAGSGREAPARPGAGGSRAAASADPAGAGARSTGSKGSAVEIDVAHDGQTATLAEAGDLVDYLWRQGFPAMLVEVDGWWRVEVRSPREQPPGLMTDLLDVLESWPETAMHPGVLERLDDKHYALHSREGR